MFYYHIWCFLENLNQRVWWDVGFTQERGLGNFPPESQNKCWQHAFLHTTDMSQLHYYQEATLCFCLLRFRHKKHLVRFRKRWFCVKIPARNCPDVSLKKISSSVTHTNVCLLVDFSHCDCWLQITSHCFYFLIVIKALQRDGCCTSASAINTAILASDSCFSLSKHAVVSITSTLFFPSSVYS